MININGIINVYKEKDITSSLVVSIIKRKLKESFPNINVKVGHFGTLDPAAKGVLPIAIGKATKLFDYFIDKDKKYKVSAEFGYETDTLDATGKIIKKCSNIPKESQILDAIESFGSGYNQIPPNISAKSINGKRAYDLARQGIDFCLEPQFVRINSIKLLKFDKNLDLIISCGKGFYVRSFVKDLAIKVNSLATVIELERIQSGPFNVENSKKIDDISLKDDLIAIEDVLFDLPVFNIEIKYAKKVLNGIKCKIPNAPKIFKAYVEGSFVGIGQNVEDFVNIKTWLS